MSLLLISGFVYQGVWTRIMYHNLPSHSRCVGGSASLLAEVRNNVHGVDYFRGRMSSVVSISGLTERTSRPLLTLQNRDEAGLVWP